MDESRIFEVNQANEKYQFEKKQEKDSLQRKLEVEINKLLSKTKNSKKLTGYSSTHDHFVEAFREYMKFILNTCSLKFTFGKYTGYYVDIILREDIEYCEWFSENVRGQDLNTLKILDYIHKKLLHKPCYGVSIETAFMLVKKIVPINFLDYLDKNKKDILEPLQYEQPKRNHCGSYEYNDEPWYPDDVCNDLCYWGDPIFSEGDLC